jgi:hypothetical protein
VPGKFEDLGKANEAYAELEAKMSEIGGSVADFEKQVEKLNRENADRRRKNDELAAEIERLKREGESEAKKALRSELEGEYESDLQSKIAPLEQQNKELQARLRQQTLEAAASRAGVRPEKLDIVKRLIDADLDVSDSKALGKALDGIRQQLPAVFSDGLGGPADTPGSKGGTGEKPPASLRELAYDKSGKATPERLREFRNRDPESYQRLMQAESQNGAVKGGLIGGATGATVPAGGGKDG